MALNKIYPFVTEALSSIEPVIDASYGPIYRCAATLEDGSVLPCVGLQSRSVIVNLARDRVTEVFEGRNKFVSDDPLRDILDSFVAGRSQISDYRIRSIAPSRFAVPQSLMRKIHGETTMSWTGWVFRMRDDRHFSYGSSFEMQFLDLPDGYDFADVVEVINHAYVDDGGQVRPLQRATLLPDDYHRDAVLGPRVSFTCYVSGIEDAQTEKSRSRDSSNEIVGASALAKAKRRYSSWPSPK